MTQEEALYLETGQSIAGAVQSQLFGKPCFKLNGKAFICFFQNDMVFKLKPEACAKALALKGSQLFDPSGKKRPMKEWAQVPFAHSGTWKKLAAEALAYAKEQTGA